jgi:hypothetical protein
MRFAYPAAPRTPGLRTPGLRMLGLRTPGLWSMALCGVGLLALAAPPARAQLIERYLNPLVPGLGTEPEVTVASRLHPDYDYRGVRVGGWLLQPELIEQAGYDSNVTGARPSQGSALVQTSGSLRATNAGSAGEFAATLTADDFRYPDLSRQSFTNWSAAFQATRAVGRDQASLNYIHLDLNQTARDLDVPLLDQPIAYRIDDLTASYRARFARTYLRPSLELTHYSYDDGSVGGVFYPQAYRDRVTIAPSLEAGYEAAPDRRIVVLLRDAIGRYQNQGQLPGVPGRDFNDASVLAGVTYTLHGTIALRLLAGYEARTFSSSAYKTIQAPVVEASASWTPTGLTTVTASAARYIEDAASESVVGLTETALRLSVDHEYLRNVVLSASAAWLQDNYQGSGQQALYEAALGATWLLNRNLRLGATYQFYSRQSDAAVLAVLTPLATSGTYAEHRVLLQLRLGL